MGRFLNLDTLEQRQSPVLCSVHERFFTGAGGFVALWAVNRNFFTAVSGFVALRAVNRNFFAVVCGFVVSLAVKQTFYWVRQLNAPSSVHAKPHFPDSRTAYCRLHPTQAIPR